MTMVKKTKRVFPMLQITPWWATGNLHLEKLDVMSKANPQGTCLFVTLHNIIYIYTIYIYLQYVYIYIYTYIYY